ncbi:MAG: patatin-like phospholipase family protein [Myxococcota bacterium]
MQVAPRDTPDDLAERFRQLKPFDDAEVQLVRALVKRPDRLHKSHEAIVRVALNMARIWVLSPPRPEAEALVVGPGLGIFRERVRSLAQAITRGGEDLDPAALGRDAEELLPHMREARGTLLSRHAGRLLPSELDRELTQKAFVLVLGGGGGCGYVHLGTFGVLERLGVTPQLIVGSSIGSILGSFRARELHYRESMVRAVTHGLTFKKLFRILEVESRYGVPGTLRLYLRSALSRFFVSEDGSPLRMREMTIPFLCVVTGIKSELMKREIVDYERAFAREFRRGAIGALLHIKDLVTSWAQLMGDLIATQGAVRPIAIGGDGDTSEFDVLDAMGFSCAVPALIHYDILRHDPRMDELMRALLSKNQVDYLVDGGVSSNVPARFAWESVQRGRLGTRNAFIYGLDCFAPQFRRNMLFLPIQRIAAENVARDKPFAHALFTYRRVLSPAALVPGEKSMKTAIADGTAEFSKEGPFVKRMMEPLTNVFGA